MLTEPREEVGADETLDDVIPKMSLQLAVSPLRRWVGGGACLRRKAREVES